LIEKIDTCPNPKGLCSMNINSEDTIIACPGKQEGQILIKYNKE